MDAFEELICELLRAEGYWVQRSYKIDLTPAEKRALDNPSMPRPEIDVVAYRPGRGEFLAIECKSYFDSGGVHARDLIAGGKYDHRYKMFTNASLRQTVLIKLAEQMAESGAIPHTTVPQLCMAYGHATAANDAKLRSIFSDRGWGLFGPDWIRARLSELARRTYDNQIASVVAKLVLPRTGPSPFLQSLAQVPACQ